MWVAPIKSLDLKLIENSDAFDIHFKGFIRNETTPSTHYQPFQLFFPWDGTLLQEFYRFLQHSPKSLKCDMASLIDQTMSFQSQYLDWLQ